MLDTVVSVMPDMAVTVLVMDMATVMDMVLAMATTLERERLRLPQRLRLMLPTCTVVSMVVSIADQYPQQNTQ
jgi:hypothetical protein